jgi:hypothetical protein
MSKLESLVPPLELCKLIPAGEFEDGCFVRIGTDTIVLRSDVRVISGRQDDIYPAPLAEEIIYKFWRDYQRPTVFYRNDWYACVIDNYGDEIANVNRDSASTAALAVLNEWNKENER